MEVLKKYSESKPCSDNLFLSFEWALCSNKVGKKEYLRKDTKEVISQLLHF
jgi:hypothetical protein